MIPGNVAVDRLDVAAESGKDDGGVVEQEGIGELPVEGCLKEGRPLPRIVGW